MKTEQLNLRLELTLVEDLEHIARDEATDRATVVRRLLMSAIHEWKLDRALGDYQNGEVSLERAAYDAGVGLREMMAARDRLGITQPYDSDLMNWERTNVTAAVAAIRESHAGGAARVAESAPEWRGESLADIPPSPGAVLLIGINPAPVSVAAGHYYQGRLGRRLWRRLEGVGLLSDAVPGREDEAFAMAGNGLTDLVKRPTRNEKEISKEDRAAGVEQLAKKIKSWKPGLILFAFRAPAVALLGAAVKPGGGSPFEGIPTFLLSGPYARSSDAEEIDRELEEVLRKLREPTHTGVAVTDKVAESNRADAEWGRAETAEDRLRVTAADLRAGIIRVTQAWRPAFPGIRTKLEVRLKGEALVARYDPRNASKDGKTRSGVLRFPKARLDQLVEADERLTVSLLGERAISLD